MQKKYAVVLSKARVPHFGGELSIENTHWVTEFGSSATYPDGHVTYVNSVQNLSEVESAVAGLVTSANVQAILSPFETGAPATAYCRSRLGFPGPGIEQVLTFTDKFRMKRLFADIGIPHTDFCLATDLSHVKAMLNRHSAIVLKPRFGGGTYAVVALDSHSCDRDIKSAVERYQEPFVVERAVEIECEYHVDSWVINNQVHSVVGRYLEPALESSKARVGYGSVMVDDSDPHRAALLQLTKNVVSGAGIGNGVLHTEFFLTLDGEILISESALRPGGGGIPNGVLLSSGVDLFDVHFKASVGEQHAGTESRGSTKLVGHLALPFEGIANELRDELLALPGMLEITSAPTMRPDVFLAGTNGGFLYATADSSRDLEVKLRKCRELINGFSK